MVDGALLIRMNPPSSASALFTAIDNRDRQALISSLKKGGDPNSRKVVHLSARCISEKRVLGSKFDVVEDECLGESVLCVAIMQGDGESVSELLRAGADPSLAIGWSVPVPPPLGTSWTSSHWASRWASRSFPSALDFALHRGVLRVNKGGDHVHVNTPTTESQCFELKELNPNIDVVLRLIAAGAKITQSAYAKAWVLDDTRFGEALASRSRSEETLAEDLASREATTLLRPLTSGAIRGRFANTFGSKSNVPVISDPFSLSLLSDLDAVVRSFDSTLVQGHEETLKDDSAQYVEKVSETLNSQLLPSGVSPPQPLDGVCDNPDEEQLIFVPPPRRFFNLTPPDGVSIVDPSGPRTEAKAVAGNGNRQLPHFGFGNDFAAERVGFPRTAFGNERTEVKNESPKNNITNNNQQLDTPIESSGMDQQNSISHGTDFTHPPGGLEQSSEALGIDWGTIAFFVESDPAHDGSGGEGGDRNNGEGAPTTSERKISRKSRSSRRSSIMNDHPPNPSTEPPAAPITEVPSITNSRTSKIVDHVMEFSEAVSSPPPLLYETKLAGARSTVLSFTGTATTARPMLRDSWTFGGYSHTQTESGPDVGRISGLWNKIGLRLRVAPRRPLSLVNSDTDQTQASDEGPKRDIVKKSLQRVELSASMTALTEVRKNTDHTQLPSCEGPQDGLDADVPENCPPQAALSLSMKPPTGVRENVVEESHDDIHRVDVGPRSRSHSSDRTLSIPFRKPAELNPDSSFQPTDENLGNSISTEFISMIFLPDSTRTEDEDDRPLRAIAGPDGLPADQIKSEDWASSTATTRTGNVPSGSNVMPRPFVPAISDSLKLGYESNIFDPLAETSTSDTTKVLTALVDRTTYDDTNTNPATFQSSITSILSAAPATVNFNQELSGQAGLFHETEEAEDVPLHRPSSTFSFTESISPSAEPPLDEQQLPMASEVPTTKEATAESSPISNRPSEQSQMGPKAQERKDPPLGTNAIDSDEDDVPLAALGTTVSANEKLSTLQKVVSEGVVISSGSKASLPSLQSPHPQSSDLLPQLGAAEKRRQSANLPPVQALPSPASITTTYIPQPHYVSVPFQHTPPTPSQILVPGMGPMISPGLHLMTQPPQYYTTTFPGYQQNFVAPPYGYHTLQPFPSLVAPVPGFPSSSIIPSPPSIGTTHYLPPSSPGRLGALPLKQGSKLRTSYAVSDSGISSRRTRQ
ncbi:hypothetical protein M427DRAFT_224954 [Gonapodya prolifera JEL478]|uniref:Ankyrin n=1 Tax=Gonapodya prolifera (strain JEL478) TaxID=1344416 RepID=A0A139AP01_GONPJ|nr:hypothetical protein M427DRAFT_224954 [Gonapodya prolifera JEL478]|eukprot:KXS18233.1 hypothetical protein M427DRAFT_224954 [Gonapodya prolifera JEL478]